MSDMYAIKATTLTALGDAARLKTFGDYSQATAYSTAPESGIYINTEYDYTKLVFTFVEKSRNDASLVVKPMIDNVSTYYDENCLIGVPYEQIVNGRQQVQLVTLYGDIKFTLQMIPVDENGNEFMYTPLEMAEKFSSMVTIPSNALELTGDLQYKFSFNQWNWFIENCGNQITTKDVTGVMNMFYYANKLTSAPFVINGKGGNNVMSASSAFKECPSLIEAPEFKNANISKMDDMYYNCQKLRYIPEPDDSVTFTTAITDSTSGVCDGAFYNCMSLRKIPDKYLATIKNRATSSYNCAYYNTFSGCYSLDEIKGLAVCDAPTWTSNMVSGLSGSFWARMKAFTFAMQEDGTPYVVKWKNQTLDFTYIGYPSSSNNIKYFLNYNSGITADKQVTDDATYQALKNDPDWFTADLNYSRYNHDSAVETINSLPDASAYLASSSGTNTIKFKGAAGANTDGGAISNLTAEEIAVATAKGWTVTLV